MKHLAMGVRCAPYLADHGFQDMVVLPGSLYVEWVLRSEGARRLRNIRFRAPVILGGDDALIRVSATDERHYAFDEAGAGAVAQLEIEPGAPARPPPAAFSAEGFQPLSDFYARLRANGNQYGPQFQLLSCIATRNGESSAKIRIAENRVIDAAVQLLAPFVLDQGRTFVLRSIERIEVYDFDLPGTLWGHATQRGDVRLFDESGKTYLELFGVALSLLEPSRATKLAIAANFTAEPLEDAIRFWAAELGERLEPEFAPYDQVFQALLGGASTLRANAGGVNAVLLSLEDWAAGSRHALADPPAERAQRCFGARARRVLPNGLEIFHLNAYETDYLYREIFEEQCYLRHGLTLRDGATVVDIGANIGLFSLFVMSRVSGARIYAFEPAPAAFELLKANCEAYSESARAFNAGVAERPGTASFTFYERSSVFSGFHCDEGEDRRAIQSVVRGMLAEHALADREAEQDVAALTAERLRRTSHECRLTSVSELIREERLERIDLLKIDAEKSELGIVQGIAEEDWPKIEQLVIEVHDPSGETVRRMQAMLAGRGYRCVVEQQALLERAGLYNVYAMRPGARAVRDRGVQRTVEDFCAALRSYADQSCVPLVLCICPRAADPELDRAEATLLSQASTIANVHTIGSAWLAERYPVTEYYDAQTHRAARMPYTPRCYAAIGTALVRAVAGLKASPYKVIALDCDNTLWKGVCGEDGAHGIELTAGHRALQEFLLRQMRAGMLLCLCSKNNEPDALEVFERRADMPLKREHFVSWRLNWRPKPANLRSLAEELDLGVESFIFIDDNPLECAEMRASCPEALTLQLPREPEWFAAFLEHIWAFDRARVTAEDRERTRMYRQGAERRRYRSETLSLREFVDGLQLRIEIAAAGEADLARLSQLTLRTNQFNFTTRRRSPAEIRDFVRRPGARCMAVRVADRFGDYGLVGVLMYETAAERLRVDTLLLSCRVLGRGVEHALISWLGARALEEGKALVDLAYEATPKNRAALEFIEDNLGAALSVPAERLAAVKYDPGKQADPEPEQGAAPTPEAVFRSETMQRIAEELGDTARLFSAIEAHRLGNKAAQGAPTLAGLWARVLGRSALGPHDNFFQVGGTSLKAVQLVALIRKELNRRVPVVSVFECPTLALFSARLEGTTQEEKPLMQLAALRGQRRRQQQAARVRAS
jgi:FkbH-like protein/FkbM family methyltransferase